MTEILHDPIYIYKCVYIYTYTYYTIATTIILSVVLYEGMQDFYHQQEGVRHEHSQASKRA